MKVLVTGGAGFIGHHLVRALLERGDEVVIVDDLSTGFGSRLDGMDGSFRFIEGSILDPRLLDEAAAGCEIVFHQAALASVARSLHDPVKSDNVNVRGTIEVMLASARQGVRRVVFAGSSSVYGVPKRLPCVESATPAPESPYGVSKLAGELYVHTLGRYVGVSTVVLRYFNVFGPSQDPSSEYAAVVPRFITAVLAGQRPTINGTGEASRDFTYIDNVVSANLLAAGSDATSLTCNVACGGRTTLLQLLDAIGSAVGTEVEPLFGPPRAGDIKHSLADIGRAGEILGYEVVVPFVKGIAMTVASYQGQPTSARSERAHQR